MVKEWTGKERSSLDYRADGRSLKEFQNDIKEGHRVEKDIIERYCKLTGKTYEQFGHDDGNTLKGRSNANADFYVDGVPLEVKFCRPNVNRFHLKKHHVESYIDQGAKILFVMGYDTKAPKFTIIDPAEIVEEHEVVVFWRKLVYRVYSKDFDWEELP